jgi:hypothetical protein
MILALFGQYTATEISADNESVLTVSGLNIFGVEDLVEALETEEYFEGHDNNTAQWLKTLEGNYVLTSMDYYVVMNKTDADKLPVEFATDVFINDTFRCTIIENHSLGEDFKDVLYVRDVEFIRQSIEYIEV